MQIEGGTRDETSTGCTVAGSIPDLQLGVQPEPCGKTAGSRGRSLLAPDSRNLDIRGRRWYRYRCPEQRVDHPPPRHGNGEESVLQTSAGGDAVRSIGQV